MIEINPVLVKELRGRMRGVRASLLLTIYLLILGGATLLLYTAFAGEAGNDLNAGQTVGMALFLVITAVALVEVCVITPLLTAGSIVGEKEHQTYDLLISSLLSPWQIVWGKLGAALAYALLLILAVVPLMSLAFLFGGVSFTQVGIALVGMTATALLYACIGLFWSTVMRSTLAASSFATGSILVVLLGIPFVIVMSLLIFGDDPLRWDGSLLRIYLYGIVLCLHPFIALALTDEQIRSGENIWYLTITRGNGLPDLLIPSPWIAYVVLSVILSAVLLLLSVRSLRRISGKEHRSSAKRASRGRDI